MRRVLALLLVSGTAYAGGTSRPNGISARGVGMGGAWAAWADDPTALYFNPGALDAMDSQVMVGLEVVLGPRRYTPLNTDGTSGEPATTLIGGPLPTVGIVGRFSEDGEPSRFTFGLGVWNTFGGRVSYPKTGMPALDVTQDLCFEINAGAAFHVSDRLSIGAAARLGLGFFHIESTMNPYDANLSANGVGAGMTVGALLRPSDNVRIGLNWRSPMRINTTGSGSVVLASGTEQHDVTHQQNWPQSAQLGVGIQASRAFKVAFQAEWTQWSQTDTIEVLFPEGALPDQIYPEYWSDNWTARVGAEYSLARAAQVRAGAYYDTQAVPDRSIERQYSDSNKVGVSLGGTVRVVGWRFDLGADVIIPRNRHVDNNVNEVMGVNALANKAPGDYFGSLITFELAASRQF